METMDRFLGKFLLAAAVALTAWAIASNPKPSDEALPADATARQVYVELDKAKLPGASQESFFLASAPDDAGMDRFVPEKRVAVFVPVDLDVPLAGVVPPAQLLPEGGPSLEGTKDLPRWGEEFPALVLTPPAPGPGAGAPALVPGTVAPAARSPGVK